MLGAGKFCVITFIISANTNFEFVIAFSVVKMILRSLLAVTTSKWELFDQHEESEEEEIQK